jgi:hypothetical protein
MSLKQKKVWESTEEEKPVGCRPHEPVSRIVSDLGSDIKWPAKTETDLNLRRNGGARPMRSSARDVPILQIPENEASSVVIDSPMGKIVVMVPQTDDAGKPSNDSTRATYRKYGQMNRLE